MPTPNEHEFTTMLAGGSYYHGCYELKPNELVNLMFDPFGTVTGNPHKDPNALAVFNKRGVIMGYLPKEWAALLGPGVASGQLEIIARVTFLGGPANTHLRCVVREVPEQVMVP